jgi:hypothetical protein
MRVRTSIISEDLRKGCRDQTWAAREFGRHSRYESISGGSTGSAGLARAVLCRFAERRTWHMARRT